MSGLKITGAYSLPADMVNDLGNPNIGLQQESEAGIGVGSRQTVYVVESDGSLRGIEVVTGQSDGRFTVVASEELKRGMNVVTGIAAGPQ